MKIKQLHGVGALGVTALTGVLLTQLMAQTPKDPATPTTQLFIEPPVFKDYQAGLREAAWKDKPLFVIFRCER